MIDARVIQRDVHVSSRAAIPCPDRSVHGALESSKTRHFERSSRFSQRAIVCSTVRAVKSTPGIRQERACGPSCLSHSPARDAEAAINAQVRTRHNGFHTQTNTEESENRSGRIGGVWTRIHSTPNSMSDSTSANHSERRGSMCPVCDDVRGIPTSTVVGNGIRTITYRCPACQRTWNISRPDKGLIPVE